MNRNDQAENHETFNFLASKAIGVFFRKLLQFVLANRRVDDRFWIIRRFHSATSVLPSPRRIFGVYGFDYRRFRLIRNCTRSWAAAVPISITRNGWRKIPESVFHFTPTFASGVNQAEAGFAILSRKILRGTRFADLRNAAEAFLF